SRQEEIREWRWVLPNGRFRFVRRLLPLAGRGRRPGAQQRYVTVGIVMRTGTGQHGQHDMVGGIDGQFEFGVATVGGALPLLAGGAAAADVVRAAVATVQAGGVEGRPADAAAAL